MEPVSRLCRGARRHYRKNGQSSRSGQETEGWPGAGGGISSRPFPLSAVIGPAILATLLRVADIENTEESGRAQITVSLDELRVMIHRLAAKDSFLRGRAESQDLLPEGHEEIADDLSETLRRFHDRRMNRAE